MIYDFFWLLRAQAQYEQRQKKYNLVIRQCRGVSAQTNEVSVYHQIDRMVTQYHAAKAGLGIAKIACFIGDKDPQLKRVAPGLSNRTWDIWILTHQDLRTQLG
jgi:hypothetical protein